MDSAFDSVQVVVAALGSLVAAFVEDLLSFFFRCRSVFGADLCPVKVFLFGAGLPDYIFGFFLVPIPSSVVYASDLVQVFVVCY